MKNQNFYFLLLLFVFLGHRSTAQSTNPEIFVDPDTSFVLTCNKAFTEVYGYSEDTNVVFTWTSPTGIVFDTNAMIIYSAGDFLLTGIDTVTHDTSVQAVHVSTDFWSPNFSLNLPNNPALCGDTISIDIWGGYGNFWWNIPDGTVYTNEIVIYKKGEYSIQVMGLNGCVSSQAFEVDESCHFAKVYGDVFYDYNQNQIKEAEEPLMTGGVSQKIDVTPDGTTIYAWEGSYYKYLNFNSVELFDWVDDPDWMLTTNNDQVTVPGAANSETNIDYGLYPTVQKHELNIYIPYVRPRCNTEVTFVNRIFNSGTYVEDGKVVVTYGDMVTYVSSSGVHDAANQTITWDYSGVKPLYYETIGEMTFLMPNETHIGEPIDLFTQVFINSNGIDVLKDSYVFQPDVHCAFDPNRKSVSPGGVGNLNLTLLGQDLTYIVEFENEGNSPAHHVKIVDAIDTNLNISTLRVLGASHLVQPWVKGNGVTFDFQGIDLAPNEKGYVQFQIKQQPDLPEFTLIKNKAYIYFDQNNSITTNTTKNTLVSAIPYADTSGIQCVPYTIRYHAETTKGVHWEFPGGFPETSQETDVTVTYSKAGGYQTKMFLNEAQYISFIVYTHGIPEIDYSFTYYDNVATFVNKTESTLATIYLWDFGDGSTSVEEEPTHTYESGNSYDIVLVATNQCGADTISRNLIVTSLEDTDGDFGFSLSPNPNHGEFIIDAENNQVTDMNLKIWDFLGRQVYHENWSATKHLNTKVDIQTLPKGLYHYRFYAGRKLRNGKFVVE